MHISWNASSRDVNVVMTVPKQTFSSCAVRYGGCPEIVGDDAVFS